MLLLVLFFFSGFGALTAEVLWQRNLSLVLGDTTQASALILSAFMCGLFLGAAVYRKKAGNLLSPLATYAGFEAGIGVFILLFPLFLSFSASLYVAAYRHLGPESAFLDILRFAIGFIVLLVPTFLMGAGFPVIAKAFPGLLQKPATHTGILYGTNLTGAAAGTFFSGFVLIPELGIQVTTRICAILYLAAGSCAYLASRTYKFEDREAEGRPPEKKDHLSSEKSRVPLHAKSQRTISLFPVYAAVFLAGFAALSGEILWQKSLTLFLFNETWSFTIMVFAFLLGSGSGTLFLSGFFDKTDHPGLFLIPVLFFTGVLLVVSVFFLGKIPDILSALPKGIFGIWEMKMVQRFLMAFFILFFPAMGFGVVVPAGVRILSGTESEAAGAVGRIYAVNCMGAVAGPLVCVFVFIPFLGLVPSILCLGLLLWAGAGILLIFHFRMTVFLRAGVCILLAGMLIVFLPAVKHAPNTLLNSPFFTRVHRDAKILYYQEGKNAIVSVQEFTEDDLCLVPAYRTIEVNGINVAGTAPELRATQNLQGHLPLALFQGVTGKSPEKVFILGLGSGESAYAMTRHPVKAVHCLELARAEVGAIPFFHDINHGILSHPKMHLILTDARNHLFASKTAYDIIENDSVHPEINIYTYTREYFSLCRKQLGENGLFSTWIPLFHLSKENFFCLARTLMEVFPHVTLWYSHVSQSGHALLIASGSPVMIRKENLTGVFRNPEILEGLRHCGIKDMETMISCLVADGKSLLPYLKNAPVNTDDNLYLAYNIPRQKEEGRQTQALHLDFFANLSSPVFRHLPEDISQKMKNRILALISGRRILFTAQAQMLAGMEADAEKLFFKAMENPFVKEPAKNALVRMLEKQARNQINNREYAGAKKRYEKILAIDPAYVPAVYHLGFLYSADNAWEKAEDLIQNAIQATGPSPALFEALAYVEMNKGRMEKAETLFQKATAMAPGCLRYAKSYAFFLVLAKKYEKAKKFLIHADKQFPKDKDLAALLVKAYLYTGEVKKAGDLNRKLIRKGIIQEDAVQFDMNVFTRRQGER